MTDALIIGGGAAGMMAAIQTAARGQIRPPSGAEPPSGTEAPHHRKRPLQRDQQL